MASTPVCDGVLTPQRFGQSTSISDSFPIGAGCHGRPARAPAMGRSSGRARRPPHQGHGRPARAPVTGRSAPGGRDARPIRATQQRPPHPARAGMGAVPARLERPGMTKGCPGAKASCKIWYEGYASPSHPRRQTPSVCAGARPRRRQNKQIAAGQAPRISAGWIGHCPPATPRVTGSPPGRR